VAADRSPSPLADVLKSQLENPVSYGALPEAPARRTSSSPTTTRQASPGRARLAWSVSDQINVKVGTLGSQDKWRSFTNTYLFNQTHMPRYIDDTNPTSQHESRAQHQDLLQHRCQLLPRPSASAVTVWRSMT